MQECCRGNKSQSYTCAAQAVVLGSTYCTHEPVRMLCWVQVTTAAHLAFRGAVDVHVAALRAVLHGTLVLHPAYCAGSALAARAAELRVVEPQLLQGAWAG